LKQPPEPTPVAIFAQVLSPELAIESGPPLTLPDDTFRQKLEEVWEQEKTKLHGRLYDGVIFSLASVDNQRIVIRQATYSLLWVQRLRPDWWPTDFGVRPVGVTAVLICGDHVVFGKRAAVASHAGLWEPAPSGSLQAPDPVAQVHAELSEELGLPRTALQALELRGLVDDGEVVDLVFRADSGSEGCERIRAHRSPEYSEIALVPRLDVESFLRSRGHELIPGTREMLRIAGVFEAP